MKKMAYPITALALMLPAAARAQSPAGEIFFEQFKIEILLTAVFIVLVLALLALVATLAALKALMGAARPQEEVAPAKAPQQISAWRSLWNRLTAVVPVERENEILTGHEYDGIRELDNRLPPWWLWGFYITIFFSIAYLLHYHVFNTGKTQAEEYAFELQKAEEQLKAYLAGQENLLDETSVTVLADASELGEGKKLFQQYCSACHGMEGQGGVGPSFADDYWINGGDVKDIFATIKYGVPQRGMIAWQSQLNPKQMQQLASFIISLEGTNPPNKKEPQGERYIRSQPTADSTQVVATNRL